MSSLPTGWELDYDGSRWFYMYKPTGHFQYHFPADGDEFPDFVDAASPAPQLAPEERLESQQQVRRQTSQHGAPTDDPDRWKSRMSATARPVSTIWEPDGSTANGGGSRSGAGDSDVFQPESFMFLGPGTYLDVSPLVEEEEEAARRAIAGGSPGTVSRGTATPIRRPGADLSPHEMAAEPNTTVAEVAAQVAVPPASPPAATHVELPAVEVHMLDSREMPQELPAEERYNPVGRMAEMPSEATAQSREETQPVELGDRTVLAPIETAVPEGFAELSAQTSPLDQNRINEHGVGSSVPKTEAEAEAEAEMRSDFGVQQQQHGEIPGEARLSQTPQEPADLPMPTYQAYQPGKTLTGQSKGDQVPFRHSMPPSVMRNEPLLIHSASEGDDTPFSPTAVPAALTLRPKAPVLAPPPPQHQPELDGPSQPVNETALHHAPSILKPARNTQNRHSIQGMPQIAADVESGRSRPAVDQSLPGVSKVPSVLKPARGRAGSIPSKNPVTVTPKLITVDRPLKSYEKPSATPYVATVPVSPREKIYMPYNGQIGATGPIAGTGAREVKQQLPIRPASTMPNIGGHKSEHPSAPSTESGTSQSQSFETEGDVVMPPPRHADRPASTPVGQSSDEQGKRLTQRPRPFIVDASLPGIYDPTNIAPASPSRASFHITSGSPSSPGRRAGTGTVAAASPRRSRSGSTSSATAMYTPSPIGSMRRNSSAVSMDQSVDGTATFTPSPESQTPPSASQSTVSVTSPPLRPSGLRHSISGATDLNESTAREGISKGAPFGTREVADEESYFPPLDRPESAAKKQVRSLATEPPIPEPRATSIRSTGPGGPVPALQRSQSLHEHPSRTPELREPSLPEPSPDASANLAGHVLSRIEEHDEPPQDRPIAPLVKRHSMSSSIQQSPRMRAQSPAASSVSSISVAGATAPSQTQRIPPQSQASNLDPASHQAPQQGQHVPDYRHHSANNQGTPSAPYPAAAGPQPVAPQQWYPQMQMQPVMANGFLPNSGPPRSPSSPVAGKEKDKKWTKWFKSSRTSKNTPSPQHSQSQVQYFVPAAGQVPPQYVQGPPPPGWAPGMQPQPVFWQPGHPHPQHVMWQPMPGPPDQGSPHINTIRRASTGGSASASGGQPAVSHNRHLNDSEGTRPNPGPASHPSSHHTRASSTQNLPYQHPNPAYQGNQSTKTAPPPLFTQNPTSVPQSVLGQSPQTPSSGSATSRKATKWFKKPAGDYSGNDWEDEDTWNMRP